MSIAQRLEGTCPAVYLANHSWRFPTQEVVHLLGLTVVIGGMVTLDLRLPGLRRDISAAILANCILPCVWVGFVIAAFGGGWLILFEATKLFGDVAFVTEMILLPLAFSPRAD